MRPIVQPTEALGLIPGQPGVQRVWRDTPVFSAARDTDNPSPITAITA
jgi:hypothetical protein